MGPVVSSISDSQMTISEPLLFPPRAKQGNLSPSRVHDRPFRLNLAKKFTTSEKGKGKAVNPSDHLPGDSSEIGSSAKKALNFDSQEPALKENAIPESDVPLVTGSLLEKEKSWYEITVEEEEIERNGDPETFLAKQFSNCVSFANPGETLRRQALPQGSSGVAADWIGNPNSVSEALDLDWTPEDEAAYNSLESPHLSAEDFNAEEDDLLGEELHDEMNSRLTEAAGVTDVANKVKNLSDDLKKIIATEEEPSPLTVSLDKNLGPCRPKEKKEGFQKERWCLGPTIDSQLGPSNQLSL